MFGPEDTVKLPAGAFQGRVVPKQESRDPVRDFLNSQTPVNHGAILQEKPDASPATGPQTWTEMTGGPSGADT